MTFAWVPAWSKALSGDAGLGSSGISLRQRVLNLSVGGSKIRITYKSGNGTRHLVLNHSSVAKEGASNSNSTATTLTPVTFNTDSHGTGPGFDAPPSTLVLSDEIPFATNQGDNLIIPLDCAAVTTASAADIVTGDGQWDTNSTAMATYNVQSPGTSTPWENGVHSTYAVTLIEVWTDQAPPPPPPSNTVTSRAQIVAPKTFNCLGGPAPSVPTNPNISAIYLADVSRTDDWLATNILPGSCIVLGDSRAAFSDFGSVFENVVNCGVGGEKFQGLLNRLTTAGPLLTALGQAECVTMFCGTNNILDGTTMANLKAWAEATIRLLGTGPLLWVLEPYQATTTPKARIDEYNAYMVAIAASLPMCRTVDINPDVSSGGVILPQYARGSDGVHLSALGYKALYARLVTVASGLF